MTRAEYYLKFIEKEQEGFRQVLKTYFPNGQHKSKRILDICSGVANEEPLLMEHFGKKTELVSLDKDESLGDLVNDLGRKSVRFGDVRELGKYVEGKFDLVIGRNIPLNPNGNDYMSKVPDCWPGVFENLPRFMEFDSMLFLTLAREDEFHRALEILDKSEYTFKVKEKNKILVKSDHIGIKGADEKDNHVIIAQPSSQLRLF